MDLALNTDVAELDREVAVLMKRKADLGVLVKPDINTPFDPAAMEAQELIAKRIAKLQERRVRALAGEPEPAPPSPPRPVLPPISRRVTVRGAAKRQRQFAYSDAHKAAFERIAEQVTADAAATLTEIEDCLEDFGAGLPNPDQLVTVTWAQLHGIVNLFAVLKADLTMSLEFAAFRRNELEARVFALEADGIKFRGVWAAGTEYQRGSLAVYAGGLWHANRDTNGRPGDSSSWTLAVKNGSIPQ